MAERELTLRIKVGDNELVETVEHTDAELEELKKEARQAGEKAEKHLDEAAEAADELGDEAEKAADQLDDAGDEASGASKKLSALSDEAYELGDALREGRFDDAAASLMRIKNISPGLAVAAGGVATAVLATGAAYAYGTSQAISFEEQMLGVRKTTGLTGQDLAKLGSDLLDLSGKLGIARGELTAIAETAGQLGIEGREDITSFTQTVAKLSSVSELTADQAGKQIAKIANIFDVPIEQARRLGSVINELSNTTTAQAGEITQALRKAGAAGEDLGLAVDQVAAMNATLIDSGLEARRAGTGLRNFFSMVRTEAKSVADVIGVTSDELNTMLEEDALGTLRQYVGALGDMDKQMRTIHIEETFGRENLQAVSALAGQTDLLSKNLDTANEGFEEGTSLQKEFEATLGAVSTQWTRLTQNLQAAAIEMSKSVLPALSSTLEGINSLFESTEVTVEAFDKLDERMEKTAGAEELLRTYRELSTKTDRTETETRKLDTATKELAERFPNLVKEYNDAGEAVGIYADKLGEVIKFRREMIRQERQEKLQELGQSYADANENVERYTRTINQLLEYTSQTDSDSDFERSLEQVRQKADEARSELDRVASTLIRLYDVEDLEANTLANDLDISEQAAGDLLERMRSLNKEQEKNKETTEDAGDAADDQEESFTAVQKASRGLIDSIAEAEQVQSKLQQKFKEATTAEARRQYQQLIDKVEDLKEEMTAAAQAPPPIPEHPQDVAPITEEFEFSTDLTETPGEIREALDVGLINSIAAAEDALEDLQQAYKEATTEDARAEIQALIDKLQGQKEELEGTRKEYVRFGPAVERSTERALTGFAEGIGKMIAGVQTARDVGSQVLMTLASLAERVGRIAIGAGIAVEGIKRALESLNPIAAIVAGTALIALAATVRSKLRSAAENRRDADQDDRPRVPRMAHGGPVSAGEPVIVGDTPGGGLGPHAELFIPERSGTIVPNKLLSMVPGRALAGDAAGVGGGAAGPSNADVLDELKKTRQAFEQKVFRLRGTEMLTQQERTQAQLDDAGIK